MNEKQELENKIRELNERVQFLEKQELKRSRKKHLQLILKVLEILIVIVVIFIFYIQINNKLIKPYKEKMDYVEEKVSSVESFVHEKWNLIQQLFPFGK